MVGSNSHVYEITSNTGIQQHLKLQRSGFSTIRMGEFCWLLVHASSFSSTHSFSLSSVLVFVCSATDISQWGSVENLDLCSFRCCCMPVLLVISYTCELDPTTSARVRRCSSLVHSLVPWAGNDVFRQYYRTLYHYGGQAARQQIDLLHR